MNAAEFVIEQFGGTVELANAINRHRSRIWRWTKSKEEGGTGGKIPTHAIPDIMEAASAAGITITAEQLIYGDTKH